MTLKNSLLAVSTLSLGALLATSAAAANLKVPQQFPTIQSAVDAAAPGDKIRIADGVYDEAVLIDGKTNLKLKGDDDVFVRSVTITNSEAVSIKELTFTEPGASQLTADQSSGLDIRFCSFLNGSVAAVITACQDSQFRDSDIIDTFTGVVIDSCDQVRVAVFAKNVPGGNFLAFGTNVTVEESVLIDTNIDVLGGNFTTVRDCVFKRSTLRINASKNALVDGNVFKKASGTGIALENTDGSTLQFNVLKKPADDGIALDDATDDNLVFANKVKKAGQVGIRIDGEDHVIDENLALKSGDLDLLVNDEGLHEIGLNVVGSSNL